MEETPRKLTPPTEREYYLKELGSMLGENPTETPLDVLSAQTEDLSPLLERDMLPPVKEDGVDLDLDAQEMSALGKRKEGDVVESGVPNGSSAEPSRRRKVHMFEYAVKSPGNKESVSKEPQFKSVEDAVLAIADGKFKDEVVSTIIDLREKNEIVHDTPITPSSVGSIILHLIRDKVLVVDKGGVFRVVRVGGGSTHESDDVKKSVDTVKTVKPSIIDKMNTFVDTVTDKALEGTAYGRLVDNIESLMRSAPPKIKAKLSEVYQSAISGQNVERILNNLAAIEGLVPDSEYAQLVQDAREGMGNPTTYPDWLIPEPPPVVEKPTFIVPDRQQPDSVREQYRQISESTPVWSGSRPQSGQTFDNTPSQRGQTFDELKAYREKNPVVTILENDKNQQKKPSDVSEAGAEKLNREMSQLVHAEVSNPRIDEKLQYYIDRAEFPITLRGLRLDLAQAENEEAMIRLIKDTSALNEEQKTELLSILGTQNETSVPYNDNLEKLAAEKTDEEKTALIEGAQNFDELYEVLRECKVIKSSNGTNVTAQDLMVKIDDARKQPEYKFLTQRITGECGLRSKVRELLDIETTLNMSKDVHVEPPPVYTGSIQAPDLYDEPIGPVRKEDLSTEESEKIEREMRAQLDAARESFATHEAEYKTKVREGKKMFRSIMEKLGAPGKQRPLLEREAEHVEAEKAYMEAKWNLKNFISGRNVKEVAFSRADSLLGLDQVEHKKIDVGVLEQAEKEYHLLQERLLEMTPEKEKSRIEKCFQKWNSLPLAQRVILSSALLTAGGVALGVVGVSGALAAFGWRAGLAFVGTNIGLAAGKLYGNAKEKEVKEKRAARLDEYGSTKTLEKDQFIEEEKNLEKFFTQEKDEVMKNQIKKGLVTAAVAGVSTVGLGMGGQAVMGESIPNDAKVSGNVDSAPKPKVVDTAPSQPAKPSWFDRLVKGVPETETQPSHPVASASPEKIEFKFSGYEPVGVKLSNGGFIDTVSKLKASLQGHSVSPAVEKLLAQSPEKIAMDLGLYKPGQVAESAFGLQGEELTMNANGDITLMHNDGSVNILFDASGKAHQFGEYAGNTMFDADKSITSPVPQDIAPSVKAPVVVETGVKSVPPAPELSVRSADSLVTVAADSVVVGSAITEAPAPKTINFEQITAPGTTYTGPEDMVSGKLPLKPEYQFDPKFKAERTAYNVRLEKELMNIPQDMFDLRYPIEYNGGRINVFQKGENILILLNGQKIGTGQIIDGQPGLQYEASLGKGMLGVKSDFEQAFEKARVEIEKNKMFFKVKK